MRRIADGRACTPETLTLRSDQFEAGVPVIHAAGCLDPVAALELRRRLDDQLAARPRAIVLDLSLMSVREPDAVQVLDHVARRAGEADIGMGLVTVDSAVIWALVTAGIDELFDSYPTIEAATRNLR